TKDLTLTIANTGSGVLSVAPNFTPNPPFSIPSPTGPLSVNAGTSQTMTLRFSPTSTGVQNATLTLTSTDPAHPTTTLQFKGTGATSGGGGGSGTIVSLRMESGTYNANSGTFTTYGRADTTWDTDDSPGNTN